jgi:hypothetical protein
MVDYPVVSGPPKASFSIMACDAVRTPPRGGCVQIKVSRPGEYVIAHRDKVLATRTFEPHEVDQWIEWRLVVDEVSEADLARRYWVAGD